jgi:hypothetical protein
VVGLENPAFLKQSARYLSHQERPPVGEPKRKIIRLCERVARAAHMLSGVFPDRKIQWIEDALCIPPRC